MDEPCSALDPISTLAIEDLIGELKSSFTIVIVTHNMQQAARVSDKTAFFNLAATGKPGRLIEIDDTATIFSNPSRRRPRTTSPAASADGSRSAQGDRRRAGSTCEPGASTIPPRVSPRGGEGSEEGRKTK